MEKNIIPINKKSFVHIIKDDITKHYEVIKKIGEGSYGKIYKAKHKISNEIRAMKQIEKKKIINMTTFKKEIEILSILDHPNIIKLFEVYEDLKYFYLINDLCTGGELLNKILQRKKENNPIKEKEASNIFKQLIYTISYIHNMNIIHRDLKPENILFINEDKNSEIKIIDFGFSIEFHNISKHKNLSSKVGTVYYMSPEILQGNYNELCDIWSCGVILYMILCSCPPFQGNNDKEIYQNIKIGKVNFIQNEWKNIHQNVKDLILNMLCPDNKRLSAKQILKNNWINNNKNNHFNSQLNINIQSIFDYQKMSLFKKIILIFISWRLNDEEVKNIKNLFYFIDKDKKGTLNINDLSKGIEILVNENNLNEKNNKINFNDLNIENIFKSIDLEKNGKINYTEFIAALIDKNIYLKDEKLNEAFDSIDIESNGKIYVKDIKQFLNIQDNNYDNIIEEWIKENDYNEDGNIDFNDFQKMMMK